MWQSDSVQADWANEHLQTIRTLMERSAIYRRALAPVMLLTGAVGIAACVAGILLPIDTPRGFVGYWLSISVFPLIGSFLLMRREAIRDKEPLWSPPTRRVVTAVVPAFVAGFAVSLTVLFRVPAGNGNMLEGLNRSLAMAWVPLGWVILYGCAAHAAGFFMPRGIKLFGWLFIGGGGALFALGIPDPATPVAGHLLMGTFFGVLHAVYGVYLYFTEKERNAA